MNHPEGMDRDDQAQVILARVQALAEKHSGGLFVVWKDAGCAGTGYLNLPNRKEIAFDFSFTDSGFWIEIREKKILSRLRPYTEYEDQAEIEAILKRIEAATPVQNT